MDRFIEGVRGLFTSSTTNQYNTEAALTKRDAIKAVDVLINDLRADLIKRRDHSEKLTPGSEGGKIAAKLGKLRQLKSDANHLPLGDKNAMHIWLNQLQRLSGGKLEQLQQAAHPGAATTREKIRNLNIHLATFQQNLVMTPPITEGIKIVKETIQNGITALEQDLKSPLTKQAQNNIKAKIETLKSLLKETPKVNSKTSLESINKWFEKVINTLEEFERRGDERFENLAPELTRLQNSLNTEVELNQKALVSVLRSRVTEIASGSSPKTEKYRKEIAKAFKTTFGTSMVPAERSDKNLLHLQDRLSAYQKSSLADQESIARKQKLKEAIGDLHVRLPQFPSQEYVSAKLDKCYEERQNIQNFIKIFSGPYPTQYKQEKLDILNNLLKSINQQIAILENYPKELTKLQKAMSVDEMPEKELQRLAKLPPHKLAAYKEGIKARGEELFNQYQANYKFRLFPKG